MAGLLRANHYYEHILATFLKFFPSLAHPTLRMATIVGSNVGLSEYTSPSVWPTCRLREIWKPQF
jgi:hypothetical protein